MEVPTRVEDLKPSEYNPRSIKDESLEALGYSMKEFGDLSGITYNMRTDRVCCGHQRLKNLDPKLPITKYVPADGDGGTIGWGEIHDAKGHAWRVRFVDWEERKEQAANLAANSPLLAGDFTLGALDMIAGLEVELPDLSVELRLPELKDLIPMEEKGGSGVVEDEPPEPPAEAFSKTGDLWLLGEHRVLCEDCTKENDVEEVLDGAEPCLLVTDSPYGVELDMEWRDRAGYNEMGPATKSYMKQAMGGKGMSGDTRGDWSDAFALVKSLEIAYVWHATSHLIEVGLGLQNIDFILRQQIVWVKTVAAMSRSAYHWKHEPCWYAVKKGKTANWCGGHEQTTVLEAASPKHIMSGSKEEKLPHPTQKPLQCMAFAIHNHAGDVYEPFLGSGTTLIAAEQLNRKCYGMEIEPRYVDVIVKRWQKFTGKVGKLVRDGVTEEVDLIEEEPDA